MTTSNSEQNVNEVSETMMDAATFAEMLDDYDYQLPKRGQIIQGRILRVEEDAVFMDVGAKRDAIVPHTDLDRLTEDLLASLEKGNEIPVYVLKTPTGDEELLVSINKGLEQKDWDQAETLMAEDDTVELDVVGYNKGGLLVQFGQLQGFVPNSHVPSLRYGGNQSQIESRKAKKVEERLLLKVLEVNQQRRRLIFSAKAAQKEQRRRRLEGLEVGSIVEGHVANIVKYGAFVDLGGGVSGLLHVSELAWHRVDHPSEELSVGEELEVQIQDVDVDRERVSLSRKAVLPNPWDTIEERYNIGDLIAGRVTNVEDFGAFVEVQSGVVGLVHVSEIEIYGPATIKDIIRPGDQVLVRIIDIDPYEERLSLSLRRVTSEEQIEWMRRQEQAEAEAAEAEEAEAEAAEAQEAEAEAVEAQEAEAEAVEAEEAEAEETDVDETTSGADELSTDATTEETGSDAAAVAEADSIADVTQAIAEADDLDSVVDEVMENGPDAADSEMDNAILDEESEGTTDEVEPVV